MASGGIFEPGVILTEPLHQTSGYCPVCHSQARFTVAQGLGYLKECPGCGFREFLRPRVLKFDKHARQWR